VTDAKGPLDGVKITLEGSKLTSTMTGANGNYRFSDLPAGGNYTITPYRAKTDFTPGSHTVSKLTKDESADFFASGKRDPSPVCTDADKSREQKTIIDRFGAGWKGRIEGDPPKISAHELAVGQKATLGPIEYKFTFVNACTGAFITATYAWEVATPVGRTRVPREKRFGCFKVVGRWTCP